MVGLDGIYVNWSVGPVFFLREVELKQNKDVVYVRIWYSKHGHVFNG